MQQRHRTAHAVIWTVLGFLLPLILVFGVMLRQNGPLEEPALRLDGPGPAP
jgi:hypothetical protein